MIWSGEDKSKAWFAQLGGPGAFLALNLPCEVNLSPSGATAAIFSCVFLLFLTFFFCSLSNQGFQAKASASPQPWLGVRARFVPPGHPQGLGTAGGLQERRRDPSAPGRRRWPREPVPNLHPAKNQSPQGALAEGIPRLTPQRGDRDRGHLRSLGLGVPFCLPSAISVPKVPAELVSPIPPVPVPTAPSIPSWLINSSHGFSHPSWGTHHELGCSHCREPLFGSYLDPSLSPSSFLGCFSHSPQLNPFGTAGGLQHRGEHGDAHP